MRATSLLCVVLAVFCCVSTVLSHDCEIGNPLLNSRGGERCCGDHCSEQEACPWESHECYVEPKNQWSICCPLHDPVPRSKVCVVPSRCRMCRPSEHLMILNGKGCPICECTSLTPCRNKECTKPNEICQMFTSCEDDLDSCEPEARCTDICRLPLDHGTCGAFYLRWYYDSSDGVCKKFNFGGCNGNRNNFLTKQDCLSNCTSSNPTTKPPPTYSWTATTTTTQGANLIILSSLVLWFCQICNLCVY